MTPSPSFEDLLPSALDRLADELEQPLDPDARRVIRRRTEALRRRRRAQRAALESVSMVHRTTQLPTQLSGGEQQRVAIARALIIEPLLLFADEPTGNLDTTNGQRVITLLRKLADGRRRAVVIVTHDSQIATCADRALVLVDGQIHYDGPAKAENWYDILQQRPNA